MSELAIEDMLTTPFPARDAVRLTEAAVVKANYRQHAPAAARLVDRLHGDIRHAAERGDGQCLTQIPEENAAVLEMAWQFLRSEGYAVRVEYAFAEEKIRKGISYRMAELIIKATTFGKCNDRI